MNVHLSTLELRRKRKSFFVGKSALLVSAGDKEIECIAGKNIKALSHSDTANVKTKITLKFVNFSHECEIEIVK